MQTTTHTSHVPPGFRFHPTDEELINFYLKKKVSLDKFDLDHVIKEVDLNKLEPWDLREKCKVDASHQTEWYFFSHKDKKYPTGTRTNRATAAGFWKATGRDKAVHSSCQRIGMRKTLVFYKGRAPHGQKTDWIMHEYRLEDGDYNNASSSKGSPNNEDGWVVCRVFKKRSHQEKTHHHSCSASASLSDEEQSSPAPAPAPAQHSKNRNPDTTQSIKSKTTSLVACKQEIVEDTAPLSNPNSSFLQLPQLESPKVPSLTNDIADLRRIFAENGPSSNNNKKPLDHLHSIPSHLETQGGGVGVPPRGDLSFIHGASRMPFFASEEDLNEFLLDNGHLALQEGWSLYDIMARSYHVPAPGDHLNTYQGDFTPCLSTPSTTRQPPPFEYPSSCEVELWNFTR